MKNLIINADDFGLHKQINAAIKQANQSGILTSTTLLAGGNAFEDAACIAKTYQDTLAVGVHFALVGCLPTVLSSSKVNTLVSPTTGLLRTDYMQFIKDYSLGRISLSQIYDELSAQVDKIKAAGITISHADSHQHLHILPGITEIVIDICRKENISFVRLPCEGFFFKGGYPATIGRFFGKSMLSTLSYLAAIKFRRARLIYPQHFFGMLAGGNMTQEYLSNILDVLPSGTSEIMMHPGLDYSRSLASDLPFAYNWHLEYQALTSPIIQEKINKLDINLISFKDLN